MLCNGTQWGDGASAEKHYSQDGLAQGLAIRHIYHNKCQSESLCGCVKEGHCVTGSSEPGQCATRA